MKKQFMVVLFIAGVFSYAAGLEHISDQASAAGSNIKVVSAKVPAEVLAEFATEAPTKTPAQVPAEATNDDEELPAIVERVPPEGFVRLAGGTLTIGAPSGERRATNETQREVTLSPFFMGIYEVTQAEYQNIMGANPSHFRGPNLPVENVTWYQAVQYCNRRSEREGLEPAYTIDGQNVTFNQKANGYRLPTEAEWEYACRAGTTTAYHTGSSITAAQANFGNSRRTTVTVGSYAPNAFGLYDMHGNVGEWCWDRNETLPAGGVNPTGPERGAMRALRGGDFRSDANSLRSAFRGAEFPQYARNFAGFRLALNAE